MPPESSPPVTQLLAQWSEGDPAALNELTRILYTELRRLAQGYLRRERPGHTLQPTALVHEAFMHLTSQRSVEWRNRGHFFALAAQVMRRILVDHARARLAAKRGGGAPVVSLDAIAEPCIHGDDAANDEPAAEAFGLALENEHTDEDIGALDRALTRLADIDSRQARVVELRYFGGLSIPEAAEALALSEATVKREWALARAWLQRELTREA